MRVFLDTNVLASALTTHGLCWELFNHVADLHALLVSEAVLDELRRVLNEKFCIPSDKARQFEHQLRVLAEVVPVAPHNLVALADADDVPIVSSAAHAQATFFVTGDKDVLTQRTVADMTIVSPRECWQRLRTS